MESPERGKYLSPCILFPAYCTRLLMTIEGYHTDCEINKYF